MPSSPEIDILGAAYESFLRTRLERRAGRRGKVHRRALLIAVDMVNEMSAEATGEVTTYSYDLNGNLLSKVDPHEASEPVADFTTSYTYDSGNRRTSMAMPSGGSVHREYDAQGKELAVRGNESGVGSSKLTSVDGQRS